MTTQRFDNQSMREYAALRAEQEQEPHRLPTPSENKNRKFGFNPMTVRTDKTEYRQRVVSWQSLRIRLTIRVAGGCWAWAAYTAGFWALWLSSRSWREVPPRCGRNVNIVLGLVGTHRFCGCRICRRSDRRSRC